MLESGSTRKKRMRARTGAMLLLAFVNFSLVTHLEGKKFKGP
jgi:hypothetical protein